MRLFKEIGKRLIERTTRSVHLTESGQVFYQHCKRIGEEAQSAQDAVLQLMDEPQGHLRISTSVAIGQYFLAPFIAEFSQKYLQITIDININTDGLI